MFSSCLRAIGIHVHCCLQRKSVGESNAWCGFVSAPSSFHSWLLGIPVSTFFDLPVLMKRALLPSLLCSNKFKLVILDECDAMTKDAQFALRRGESLC